jgi:hypothetical protein
MMNMFIYAYIRYDFKYSKERVTECVKNMWDTGLQYDDADAVLERLTFEVYYVVSFVFFMWLCMYIISIQLYTLYDTYEYIYRLRDSP